MGRVQTLNETRGKNHPSSRLYPPRYGENRFGNYVPGRGCVLPGTGTRYLWVTYVVVYLSHPPLPTETAKQNQILRIIVIFTCVRGKRSWFSCIWYLYECRCTGMLVCCNNLDLEALEQPVSCAPLYDVPGRKCVAPSTLSIEKLQSGEVQKNQERSKQPSS